MKLRRTREQFGSLTIEERQTRPAVWVYRWREGTVRRKALIGPASISKTKARMLANEFRSRPASPASTLTAMTVADLVDDYKKHELGDDCGKTAKVAKAYRYIFATYVIPRWGSLPLGAVKAVEVESWLKSLMKANGTKAKIREVFGAVFRHGMRHDLYPANPIANVRQARKRETEPSILEPKEFLAILAELKGVEPVRTAFLVAGHTGLRRGEVFGLKWGDIDFERAEIRIRRSYVDGVVGPPKTETSRRPVVVSDAMCEALKDWQKQTSYKDPDDWVFASEVSFGNPLWPGTLWQRNVRPAIDRAEVKKPKLGWHTLRRSHASLALSPLVGASLRTVMEMMRHASPQMTLGTYAQSISGDNREASSRIAELLTPKRPAA